jgi:hypothetical protein
MVYRNIVQDSGEWRSRVVMDLGWSELEPEVGDCGKVKMLDYL